MITWNSTRRFVRGSFRPRLFIDFFVIAYLVAVTLSIVASHLILVIDPTSNWGTQLVAPVAKGLEFVDTHWRAVLLLIAPFLLPYVQSLIPRIRKIGSVEFDPISLAAVESHRKVVEKAGE